MIEETTAQSLISTWHTFPLSGKHPLVKWTQEAAPGYKLPTNATGYGIATGPSHLVVIDIDGEKGLESAKNMFAPHGGIPHTFTVETGGGGLHLYFQAEPGVSVRNSSSKLAENIDVRAEGGYVVGPGSTHPSGDPYTLRRGTPPVELPPWLLEALTGQQAPATDTPNALAAHSRDLDRADASLTRAAKKLAKAAQGKRNEVLNALTFSHTSRFGHVHSDEDIRAVLSSVALDVCGLPASEVGATFASALAAGRALSDERRNGWRSRLSFNPNGTSPDSTPANAMTVVQYHENLRGLVRLNELSGRIQFIGVPPWSEDEHDPTQYPRDMKDSDSYSATTWFRDEMGMNHVSDLMIHKAITSAAESDSYHPFREYLERTTWDRTPRLARWLVEHAGAEDTLFNREAFTCWMISAVARTYRPGCQADYVLILEGAQGIRKTSFFGALGGEFFTNDVGDISNKDAVDQLKGFVIVEFGELENLHQKEVELVKAFLTRRQDNVRAAYKRTSELTPRRCIFAGTTNRDEYLKDSTGARRFWPVAVSPPDAEALVTQTLEHRDQLWAEALHLYEQGTPWWFETGSEVEAEAAEAQEDRRVSHPWEAQLAKAVKDAADTSAAPWMAPTLEEGQRLEDGSLWYITREQAYALLQVDPNKARHSDSIQLANTCKALGWEGRVWMRGGVRTKRYLIAAPELTSEAKVNPPEASSLWED